MTAPTYDHIYINGFVRSSYSSTKIFLKSECKVQLRKLLNLSWINDDILEIIVLSSYTTKLKEKICTIPSLTVLESFDPLSPKSYNSDIDDCSVNYDQMKKSLRRTMIKRLAQSSNESSNAKTREYINDWILKRGWCNEFNSQLIKCKNSRHNATGRLSPIIF